MPHWAWSLGCGTPSLHNASSVSLWWSMASPWCPRPRVEESAGAGAGKNAKGENGDGGGLLTTAGPVGAYVIRGSSVTWQPAVDVYQIVIATAVVVSLYLFRRTHKNTTAT